MPEVSSSVILRIDHEPAERRLVVTFVGGRRYAYAGVDDALYRALIAAPSIGTFFNARIRDAFPHVRLNGRRDPGRR